MDYPHDKCECFGEPYCDLLTGRLHTMTYHMDYPHDKCVFHGDKFHGDKVCVCDLQKKLPNIGGA